jgi:hypothetical protein
VTKQRLGISLFAGLLVITMSVALSCSKKSTNPTDPPSEERKTITVIPTHGAPGSPIDISGYQILPLDTGVTLLVGNFPTPFLADSTGIRALIPLFLDSGASWPTIPVGLQNVYLLKGIDTVAQALGALSIDSLPHMPGSTETIRQDMVTIANSLKSIWTSLPQLPGEDVRLPGYRFAIMTMLDSLVAGTDSSLQSIISGTSSWTNNQAPDLDLQDALMASSGALEFYNEFAGSVSAFSGRVTAVTQSSVFCRGGGPDMDLACELQIYTLLEDYKNYVVKPVTTRYAESVKIAADLIAISGLAAKPIAIINALMTVFEFTYGTLAPSLFAAEVTAFTLTMHGDTIGVNEPTLSTISVYAKNHPSTIKATTVLDMLIDGLGLANLPSGLQTEFREILKESIKFALDLYRKGLVAYNDDHGVFIDPEVDLPLMTWGPITINHSDLVELYSGSPEILAEDTALLEWIGKERGNGTVQVRSRGTGERAKVLYDNALCLFCVYSGGAFGPNTFATENKTVTVGYPANLNIMIVGLPGSTRGGVYVDGPGSYTSGKIESDTSLKNLEPGAYHMYAFEVLDSAGGAYVPEPVDTNFTLNDEDSASVTVNYEAKYGSLLVTVSGLLDSSKADINVKGPQDTIHVVNDTLLDSLLRGDYKIEAHPIADGSAGDSLIPNPPSQTVTVIGHQTALAAVSYGGGITMEVQIGNPYLVIRPVVVSPIGIYTYISLSGNRVWDLYPADSAELNGPPDTLFCLGGKLVGGNPNGTISTTLSAGGIAGDGNIMYSQTGNKSMTITYSAMASVPSTMSFNNEVNVGMTTSGWVTLVIKNRGNSTEYLKYQNNVGGTIIGANSYASLNYLYVNDCAALGYNGFQGTPIFQYVSAQHGQSNVQTGVVMPIPPGTHYVQLLNMVTCSAAAGYTPATHSANFSGTTTLIVEP